MAVSPHVVSGHAEALSAWLREISDIANNVPGPWIWQNWEHSYFNPLGTVKELSEEAEARRGRQRTSKREVIHSWRGHKKQLWRSVTIQQEEGEHLPHLLQRCILDEDKRKTPEAPLDTPQVRPKAFFSRKKRVWKTDTWRIRRSRK